MATMAASTASSATSSTVSSCSCRPMARRPMSHSGLERKVAFRAGRADAAAASRPTNGSLSASLNAMGISLSQELAFAPDDRQVDELGPGVALGRISDVEAAEVDTELFHRVDELLPGEVAP